MARAQCADQCGGDMAKCARFGRTIGQPEQFAPVPFAQAFLVK